MPSHQERCEPNNERNTSKRNGLLKGNDNDRVLILLACDIRRLSVTLEHQKGLQTSTTIKVTPSYVHVATLFTTLFLSGKLFIIMPSHHIEYNIRQTQPGVCALKCKGGQLICHILYMFL